MASNDKNFVVKRGITIGQGGISPFSLPDVDGSVNQLLKTNGSGVVTWSTLTASDIDAAASSHIHPISDVTNLQTELNAKVTGNTAITGATNTKITYDSKGLVTAGAALVAGDLPSHTHTKANITDFAHAHGNITDAGAIGSTTNLVVTTTTSGVLTTSSRSGIDSRSTFPPDSHAHGNITNAGAIGAAADLVAVTTTSGVLTTASRSGIDSRSTFPPATHTHAIADVTNLQTELNAKVTGNTAITAGTATKITYDTKGLVTAGTTLIAADLPSHTHTKSEISDFAHTHVKADITDFAHTHPVADISDSTTLGQNLTKFANPSAIRFIRINAANTVDALDAASFRTAIGAGTSSTVGTVTSVGGTGTVAGITLTGTVTASGNLTLGGTLSTPVSTINDATTVGQNIVKLTNPSAIRFLRINAANTVDALDAATFRTAIGAGTSSTTGTVTSVAAGNGLDFTTFTTSGSVVLGTPGSLTGSTTNAVTATSHTHAVSLTAANVGAVAVNTAITGATNTKITYDAKGLVTAGTSLTSGDLPSHTHTKANITDFAHTHPVSEVSDATTVGQNLVKLTNPSAIRFLRVNANNTVDALTDSDFRTAIGVGFGGASVEISATAPLSPTNEDMWWDSVSGSLFVYYDDGTSSQWVPASPSVLVAHSHTIADVTDLTLVGTVSQSLGIPTGAIIEEGSNANGTYTKYADGTMIAWRTASTTDLSAKSIATSNGLGGFRTSQSTFSYPASFISAPTGLGGITNNAQGTRVAVFASSGGAQSWQVAVHSINTGTQVDGIGIHFYAVGRWF